MDVTSTGAASAPQQFSAKPKPDEQKSALSTDFETFLKMLTTQMENQDPLNPMQSSEFATQLATFSSVEQQTKTNDLLTSMASQLGIMSMTQISGWVGMDARTADPVLVDGEAVELSPQPARAADRMAIVVRNEDGLQVGRTEMAASDAPLSWMPVSADGAPLAAGSYTFQLESLSAGAVLKTEPLETYARIVEVRNDGGQTMLVLSGGTKVAPDAVTALRQPGA